MTWTERAEVYLAPYRARHSDLNLSYIHICPLRRGVEYGVVPDKENRRAFSGS